MKTMLWLPNKEEEPFVACIGRMALDALAANGIVDRATFVKNLRGLADCIEGLRANKALTRHEKA